METERSDVNPFTPPENDKNVLAAPIAGWSNARFSWMRMLAYSFAFGFGSFLFSGLGLNFATNPFSRFALFLIVTVLMGALCGSMAYIASWAIRRALFGTDDSSASCTFAKHLTHDQRPEA